MNLKEKEIMLIAQEECAEVTQAISKVFRFGMDEEYNGQTNKMRLEEEVGDLLCMIDLMIKENLVDEVTVHNHKNLKFAKLQQWSSELKAL